MLAEENKNAGPSALDGKPAEIFIFPGFIVHLYAFLTLLFMLSLSSLISLMLACTLDENMIKVNEDKGCLGICY